jgi:hypothetical protein
MSLGVLGVDMRQLDTCDFCGEQPEGVYEVVPGTIAGGPQRLALCASCRDTLQSVVDPLLDAAERGPRAESSTSSPADSDQHSEPERGPTASRADQPDISMPNGSESSDDAAAEDTAVEDAAAAGSATEHSAAEESTTEDATARESAADESGSTESPAEKPDGYAQVLRLLQNRNEAMPRADLRALATNAYDLGDRTFEDAVDAAIENGAVEETADGLRTL